MGKKQGLTKGSKKIKGEWRPTEACILPFQLIQRVIQAVQYDGLNGVDIVKKFNPREGAITSLEYLPATKELILRTLAHAAVVSKGEWIIKNPDGEFELVGDEEFKKVFVHAAAGPDVEPFLVIYDFERSFAKIGQAAVIIAQDAEAAEMKFREETGIKSKFDKVVVIAISKLKTDFYYYAIKKN